MTRTDNRGVAKAFANQQAAINSNGQFFSPDGVTLFSYGVHWPIAIWHQGCMYFHNEKRSPTTSKQTSYARTAAAYANLRTVHVETRKDLLALQGKVYLKE